MDRREGTGQRHDALRTPSADDRIEALLAAVETALLAAYSAPAVETLLAPIRKAQKVPKDKRDPAETIAAIELIEDVLEAAALAAG